METVSSYLDTHIGFTEREVKRVVEFIQRVSFNVVNLQFINFSESNNKLVLISDLTNRTVCISFRVLVEASIEYYF